MKDNNERYRELRERYPEFVYEAWHHEVTEEGLKVWFDFRMGDVVFHPEAVVERRPFLDFGLDKGAMEKMVFDIGMIELLSYWKCACPPTVRVKCGPLGEKETAFWKKLYWNGLGEFFYTNGIQETPETFLQVESGKRKVESSAGADDDFNFQFSFFNSYLVPIGGGKDSVVTLELLRRAGKVIRPLIMNPRGATVECARVAGFPQEEVLVIRRKIDPTLLELNAKGYLNGHTPFSAMLAFYTRLVSALAGVPNVALSNENSANESTVKGSYVNHQYSKSLEFEDDFRAYCPGFNYFSFLRPLSELQIARLFSRFTAYHEVFRSCNVGSKEDIWCGHCAKCLFAYIILSPFIEPEKLNRIFGKPMFDDLALSHEFKQLIGEAETKPFECVGTVSEVRQALTMTLKRWYPMERPALLKDFKDYENLKDLDVITPMGNLNNEEYAILEEACTEKND
jgi:hypothetical protein